MNMIEACDGLNIIREKNQQNPEWINRDLYRQLYNPTLYVLAYERQKSKPGNMTPGTDGETLDGYSLEEIQKTIDLLRTEQYWPKPVRRTYIPKKAKGKFRPLGIPSPRDKVIQECIRLILEAIYESGFHENSHGFRPGRSCHTALESLRRNWVGTKWVIEADITQCFDKIDHQKLLDILREKIQDDRFINLIRKFLKAGYLENWTYHKTYSGTPQGSVISPILTNIYLDKLDRKLDAICQQNTQGEARRANVRYAYLMGLRKQFLIQGEASPGLRKALAKPIREINLNILRTPVYEYNDPSYTRVKFLRYADDVIIGVIGPKTLAEQVREELSEFLAKELKLELNQQKTIITHPATERAQFLGYLFQTAGPRWRRRNLQRKGSPHNIIQTIKTTTGNITLLVPLRNINEKLKKYMKNGQPASMNAFINQPVDHIIEHYNGALRGWYNYYQLAENVGQLNYAHYIFRYSLAKTIAHKEKSSVSKVFQKCGKDITFQKPNGRKICLFNQPMKQVKKAKGAKANLDSIPTWGPRRTQSRLTDNCVVCDSSIGIEMHHVRHIRKRGETVQGFSLYLASINRKQVPVCHKCHREIHNGRYDGAGLADILNQIQTPNAVL
jgi:group II intron reverse transcriptase/maturase